MEQNRFIMGCNYSNRDIRDGRSGWTLCPVQNIDTVLTNRYGMNVDDTFSVLYYDLYLRQLKEELKHTMLVHESVFESQIHELHRLYRRQKELMMEIEVTRHCEELYSNSGILSPRPHWMSSSVSTYCPRSFPYGENIPNQLDLNEPAKIEEHSDYGFNQFLSSVTSDEIGEESDKKNEGDGSIKGSYGMNVAQGQPLSVKCQGEYGIDLNVSLLSSEEEVTIVKKFETEKPQESLSVSLHEKHGSEQSRVLVQALPCSNSILYLAKQYKPLRRGSRPGKKVKLGLSNNTYRGSDCDPHSNAQATSESQSNQASMEKGCLSFLPKVIPARKQTNLGKIRPREQQMKSSHCQDVVAKKSGRTKRKKSRRISLVTEGIYQEISAAEAIVDMSRKSGRETSDCITPLCRNLLWLAEISSLVSEDYEVDDFEARTLHLSLEELKKILILKSADNNTAVSSINVHVRQRRSWARRGKRKCKDDQYGDNPSLGMFSECEANEDMQVIEKVTEASESKPACRFPENKSKSSPLKPIDAFTFSVKENTGVNWGVIRKRKRGSRIPATDFQKMIINQVIV